MNRFMGKMLSILLVAVCASPSRANENYQSVLVCDGVVAQVRTYMTFFITPGPGPAEGKEAFAEIVLLPAESEQAPVEAREGLQPMRHRARVIDFPDRTRFELYALLDPEILFSEFDVPWVDIFELAVPAKHFGGATWGTFNCVRGNYLPGQ